MTEQERLQEWLQRTSLTTTNLAHEIGMGYVPVYRMVRGDRGFSDGFRLRYIAADNYRPAYLDNNLPVCLVMGTRILQYRLSGRYRPKPV